jgi:hypothetical protein
MLQAPAAYPQSQVNVVVQQGWLGGLPPCCQTSGGLMGWTRADGEALSPPSVFFWLAHLCPCCMEGSQRHGARTPRVSKQ